MKTMFVNKVIIFQETLEYQNAINLCYGKQETQELQGCVLDPHTWAICKMVVETMFFCCEAMYHQSNSRILVIF
jgi:hypothetical protein